MQTGKTLVLTKVLPAVVAKSPVFGVGKPNEARVIMLDLTHLPMSQVRARRGKGGGGVEQMGGRLGAADPDRKPCSFSNAWLECSMQVSG